MSGYDVVATIIIGNVIGNVAIGQGTLAAGVASVATIILLQQLIKWLPSRYLVAHHAVREPPIVVLWEGVLLEDRLRETRVSADEVRAAVRKEGYSSLSEVRLVVLENDGDWSVIGKAEGGSDDSALFGLPIPGRPENTPQRQGAEATPAPAHRLP
jgi:uncharacterized membrane protein YcaP (DUF421 family)